jgi:hypothetical protein
MEQNMTANETYPCAGPGTPWGFQGVKAPVTLRQTAHKDGNLSALCTSRLYPKEIFGAHFC